jgi:hypothetical protein
MVTTGGPSAGGSGFEYGENTVAARLSIDIPTEGVQSLREITQEISRFRTEMEAAARSEGDFIGFFQNLPSIAAQASNAFKTYADQLERGLALQQRMAGAVGQWDVQPGSSPDNFKGMSNGMGRSSGEVQQQTADTERLREMGPAGERQYLNVHSQRGATQPGDIPSGNSQDAIAAATERISARERVNQERTGGGDARSGGRMGQTGGIAREIMNEFGSGGGFPGAGGGGVIGGILGRGVGAMKERARRSSGGNEENHTDRAAPGGGGGAVGDDDGGGGAGGIMGLLSRLPGGLGMAAGAAGLGLGAFQAAQFMGPKIQNLKDQGMVQGGGAKEGLEQEMNARIMGLNPFITNDQSRSIIQSALRDGYSGKEYETVTKFMQDNIKDFAMTVQESRDVVKKQMVEGGMSPESIAASLEQQKNLSKGSYLSFPDRKNAMLSLTGQMSDMGVPGSVANKAGAQALEMFSDNQMLKGMGADMMAAGTSDDLGQQGTMMALMGITPSGDFSEWSTQIAGAGSDGQEKLLRNLASQSKGNIGTFRLMLQKFGGLPNVTVAQAREMYARVTGGKSSSAAGQSRIDQQSGSAGSESIEKRSFGSRLIGDLSGGISAAGGKLSDLVTGNWGNIEARNRGAEWQTEEDHIPILDKLVESGGGDPNKLMVQDASGQWKKLQSGNKDQIASLANGGKWKRADDKDSTGYTLAQAGGVMNSNFGKQDVSVQGQVAIHVTTDPGVKVSGAPKTVTLTQNQIKANAGWATATMNNPPPGDR